MFSIRTTWGTISILIADALICYFIFWFFLLIMPGVPESIALRDIFSHLLVSNSVHSREVQFLCRGAGAPIAEEADRAGHGQCEARRQGQAQHGPQNEQVHEDGSDRRNDSRRHERQSQEGSLLGDELCIF